MGDLTTPGNDSITSIAQLTDDQILQLDCQIAPPVGSEPSEPILDLLSAITVVTGKNVRLLNDVAAVEEIRDRLIGILEKRDAQSEATESPQGIVTLAYGAPVDEDDAVFVRALAHALFAEKAAIHPKPYRAMELQVVGNRLQLLKFQRVFLSRAWEKDPALDERIRAFY